MNRLVYLLIFILFLSACIDKQKQLDNQKYILGDWIKVKTPSALEFITPGFSFKPNGVFDNKAGYFKTGLRPYLGIQSKFRITDDSLSLFDLADRNWHSYKILKLSSDSLKLERKDEHYDFIRLGTTDKSIPFIDKITLSTSGCYGPCPILKIIIDSNGKVLFEGRAFIEKIGLFKGNISKRQYQEILNSFQKADIESLKTIYKAEHTDDETITVTFEKNGKVFKTVSDYGGSAPIEFVWACIPLKYLYQTIPLR